MSEETDTENTALLLRVPFARETWELKTPPGTVCTLPGVPHLFPFVSKIGGEMYYMP